MHRKLSKNRLKRGPAPTHRVQPRPLARLDLSSLHRRLLVAMSSNWPD